MLSRVAENLYWISRYVERAENVARLLDVGFHLELDAAELGGGDGLGPIDGVLAILACREAFEHAHGSGPKDRDAVLRFLTFDDQHGQSILAMLARARENARGCQETISGEAWSHINRFYLFLRSPRAQRRFAASPPHFFNRVKRACILFSGLVDGTLPRSEAFHFIQLGRCLERVNQISRILNIRLHGLADGGQAADPPLRVVHWASLLRSCSGYEAYLREHHDTIDPEGVVRYLVLDDAFPRAMRFCISCCLESLREITGDESGACGTEAERRLGRLESELRYLDVGEIFDRGLSPFLCGIQDECNQVGAEIHRAFFFT